MRYLHGKHSSKHIFPPEFYKNNAYWRGLILGVVYLALLISQLFTYEHFFTITQGYGIVGGDVTAAVLAGLIPLIEAAALPFLFSMKLDWRWRDVSAIAAVLSPLLWLLISMWVVAFLHIPVDSGIFGATIPLLMGWWNVLFAAMLLWATILVLRELPPRTHIH